MKVRARNRAAARILLVLPRGGARAARRLGAELGSRWDVERIEGSGAGPAAAEALGARAREALAARSYEAIIVVDGPDTRACLASLREFSRVPIVLAILGRAAGDERPSATQSGGGFAEPRRERERLERQTCAADETWAFGPGPARSEGGFSRRPRPEAAWMASRLRAVGRARKRRALTSIIVPCVDGLRWTRECLEAVKRHTKSPYEIILVDNASTDGTGAWARRAGARVIRNKTNLGFAKAINQGMTAARGRWLVWLNNDVVVTPGWLERLIDCAERAPWIAAVGPCTDVTVGFQRVDAPQFKNARDLAMFSEAWALRHAGRAEGVPRLTGFCVLVKREAVRLVGLLDERFGLGTYEEFDYCLRLRQAGYDLAVARDVFVRHHGHKSFRSFEAMAEAARRNRELFLDKWCRQALSFLDDVNPAAAGAG
jgi:GT2 family glycosyltransferase